MERDLTKIRELRKSKNLKQTEMATILSVSQQTYSRYETGDILIDVDSLIKLSVFYDTNMEYLLGLTDDSHRLKPIEKEKKLLKNN